MSNELLFNTDKFINDVKSFGQKNVTIKMVPWGIGGDQIALVGALSELGVSADDMQAIRDAGGYTTVLANAEKQLALQETLDPIIQKRIASVENALRELGWSGGRYGHQFSKPVGGMQLSIVARINDVGEWGNAVSVSWERSDDDNKRVVIDGLIENAATFAATVDRTLTQAAPKSELATSIAPLTPAIENTSSPILDQATTRAAGLALIESVALEFGGVFSDWRQSGSNWQYADLTIGEFVVAIGVSDGGVVSVNRDPFTPHPERTMNVTRDAIASTLQAALPVQDMKKLQAAVEFAARVAYDNCVQIVNDAHAAFKKSEAADSIEVARQLYDEAKKMAREGLSYRDVIKASVGNLDSTKRLFDMQIRVKALNDEHKEKSFEIGAMRKSDKRVRLFSELELWFSEQRNLLNAEITKIGFENGPNSNVDGLIQIDVTSYTVGKIESLVSDGRIRTAYEACNAADGAAWAHINSMQAVVRNEQTRQAYEKMSERNLEDYLMKRDVAKPEGKVIAFADLDPDSLTFENIHQVGDVEITNGFGKTAGKKWRTLSITSHVEDHNGVVRNGISVKIASDGKKEFKYGSANDYFSEAAAQQLIASASKAERGFLAEVNKSHFKERARGMSTLAAAGLISTLRGKENVYGSLNYAFALAAMVDNGEAEYKKGFSNLVSVAYQDFSDTPQKICTSLIDNIDDELRDAYTSATGKHPSFEDVFNWVSHEALQDDGCRKAVLAIALNRGHITQYRHDFFTECATQQQKNELPLQRPVQPVGSDMENAAAMEFS